MMKYIMAAESRRLYDRMSGDKLSEKHEYSYAAEPPVQFRLSHLSRRSEPL